jgi:hypothetical protein
VTLAKPRRGYLMDAGHLGRTGRRNLIADALVDAVAAAAGWRFAGRAIMDLQKIVRQADSARSARREAAP